MNRSRRVLARPFVWLLLAALLLGSFSPLVSSGGAVAEDPPAVEPTEVPGGTTLQVVDPTAIPTEIPDEPTDTPMEPTAVPTDVPVEPTLEPSAVPVEPTAEPSEPTSEPSVAPSLVPSVSPTDEPSVTPTPTVSPTVSPTSAPMSRMGIQSLIATTGTLTKTASTTNPVQGELVTFTITIAGEAEAGTHLHINDGYQDPGLAVGTPRIGEQLNVGDPTPTCTVISIQYQTLCYTDITVSETGAYRFTYAIDATVASDAAGTLQVWVEFWDDSAAPPVQLSVESYPLTVAEGTLTWTGTITKVASTTTPHPGETVTFTITASGRAVADPEKSITIRDRYALTGLTVGAVQFGESSNVSIPAAYPYSSSVSGLQGYGVVFYPVVTGAFSLTFQVSVTVATTATGTLGTHAELHDTSTYPGELDDDSEDLTVSTATVGTVTKVASNLTPHPGDMVTFTITVTGWAAADTTLAIRDLYVLDGLTLAAVQTGAQSNVTGTVAHPYSSSGIQGYDVLFLTEVTGAFSLTFQVEVTVATMATGTLATTAELYDVYASPDELGDDDESLTVSTATVGTITKVASNLTPHPGDVVTFTITVTGWAVAGTALHINDRYVLNVLSPALPQVIGVPVNLTIPASYPYSESGVGTLGYSVTFSTLADGAYSLTFQVAATVATSATGTVSTVGTLFGPGSATPLSSDGEDLEVSTTTIGTITKVASDTTPDHGEVVTFTITATGWAVAGVPFLIRDGYDLEGLTLGTVEPGDTLNVTGVGVNPWTGSGQGYDVTFSTATTGAFSLSYQVESTVAFSATGTLHAAAGLLDASLEPPIVLHSDDEDLTVSNATVGTITKVASTTTPDQGEVVTFTITATGWAAAGTAIWITDSYPRAGLALGDALVTGTPMNMTEPDATQFTSGDGTQGYTVAFLAQADGVFSLTFQVEVTVAIDASGTLSTGAALSDLTTILDRDDEDLTVTIPTSGEVSIPPAPIVAAVGGTVTVTTTLSGRAMADTLLFLDVSTNASDLTLGSLAINNLQHLTSSAGTSTASSQLTVTADGPYSATVTATYTVAAGVLPGWQGSVTTCLYPGTDATGTALDCGASAVGVPLVAPTVTKTTTDLTPRPEEPVTYTITVSGSAVAETTLTVDDVLPGEVTLVGMTPVGENLAIGTNQGSGNALSLPLTVQTDGAYGLTVVVETMVNEGVARDTVVTNTACVDMTDGPQDTCAAADVTVQRPLTFLERLIRRLVAILQGIIGGP